MFGTGIRCRMKGDINRLSELLEAQRHVHRLAVQVERGCCANAAVLASAAVLLNALRVSPVGHLRVESDHVESDGFRMRNQGV